MNADPYSDRTHVRQAPSRARYDLSTIRAILDAGRVCHVGFVDQGQPLVIPMNYARDGDRLLLHAGPQSRLARVLANGAQICVTVTHEDGLVLAPTAVHHSLNYRSVVVLGTATPLVNETDIRRAWRAFFEHFLPGRWAEIPEPNTRDLATAALFSIPIKEASAKVRSGPPTLTDRAAPPEVWFGEVPLHVVPQPSVPHAACSAATPASVQRLVEGRSSPLGSVR